MQAVRLTDSLGLPQAISARFLPEAAPRSAGAPLWAVRESATGVRRWLLYLEPGESRGTALAGAFKLLESEHPHLLRLAAAELEAAEPYLLFHWEGEQPLSRQLGSPARERAALQLLGTVQALQGLPEPVALPELTLDAVWALPRTEFVRIAGLHRAVAGAGVEARRGGRAACAAILGELLGGAQGRAGLGETDQDALAAWENDGAEAYPALLTAMQRLHLSGLAADF
jgi:hypothetical protein